MYGPGEHAPMEVCRRCRQPWPCHFEQFRLRMQRDGHAELAMARRIIEGEVSDSDADERNGHVG